MVCFFSLCLHRFLKTVVICPCLGSLVLKAVPCPHEALGIGFGEPEGPVVPSPACLPWMPGFSYACLLFCAVPCSPCGLRCLQQCFSNAGMHQKHLEGLAEYLFWAGGCGGGNGKLSSGLRVCLEEEKILENCCTTE